ncbi:MAG: PEP-CTERM sorting domain-containing protein [Oceanicoccus sp.]|uniref:PEP-CTERM sorting domain-containing protein n=1 Tax=Oceanicoccus sp. TaxID=2691044 RepID=UPI00262103B7|nr:PEP-CTERM sorting domain-containing protein [Oceanicoccus sp.]MCP3909167.1 PEP-CTERM sorting domain-containing protein [Oceanicoccus sp.]
MKKQVLYGVIAGTLMLSAGSATAIVIDDFSGNAYSASAPSTGDAAGISSSGFARTVDITTSAGDTTVKLNSGASLGAYSHSQDAGVTGTSQVTFDLGGLDVTEGSTQNAFRLGLISVDSNGIIGINVDGAASSLSTNSIIIANNYVLPSYADFLFSDFVGTVDFTNVNTFTISVDGSAQAALNTEISIVGTACSGLSSSGGSGSGTDSTDCEPTGNIPEPTTLVLMTLGLAGLGYRRRRLA